MGSVWIAPQESPHAPSTHISMSTLNGLPSLTPNPSGPAPALSVIAAAGKKRKAKGKEGDDNDDAGSNAGGGPKKKQGYSCSECHRRKQKCDRNFPCQHCLARKVPDRCRPFTPGKQDEDLVNRLTKVEKILAAAFPHLVGVPDGLPASAGGSIGGSARKRVKVENDEDSSSGEETSDDQSGKGGGRLTKGKWFGVSAVESMSHAPILERLQADTATIEMALEESSSPAENLQRLITECGVSPTKVAELVQELPPKEFANTLVDWFFSKINFTRYPIHEGMFRAAYESLYANGLKTDPANVRCLPLVFIILATAVRLAPERVAGDDRTRRLTSLRYYWSSRRSILIATAIQSESLELVITRLLSSRYLIMVHDRRLTECWSQLGASLRTAQAIGLHRDGSKLGLDPFQTEYRRRIWSYLYHADRTYSLILGRPPAISDDYTDTLPPSNLVDSELVAGVTAVPRPLSQPTQMTFSVLRHNLSKIIGKVTHHFQQLSAPSHYSDVLNLDAELEAYVKSLPPHFRLENPDRSLDILLGSFLPMHRFFLSTEIFFVRITLHRPWLLRKLKSERYLPSRNACFESAKKDFLIRQSFKKECSADVAHLLGGQFREFNAAMIAGISAIVDPFGPDAEEMRGILSTFLVDHPQEAMIDETTKKERSIIATLSQRSSQLLHKNANPVMIREVAPEREAHAQALLGLGQSQQPYPAGSKHHEANIRAAMAAAKQQSQSPSFLSNQLTMDSTLMQGQALGGPMEWSSVNLLGENGKDNTPTGSTPPSLEDENAQSLLDLWCQENLPLEGLGPGDNMGSSSNMRDSAQASMASWNNPNLGLDPMSGMNFGMNSMSNNQQGIPGDFNLWNDLIDSILSNGNGNGTTGATPSGHQVSASPLAQSQLPPSQ